MMAISIPYDFFVVGHACACHLLVVCKHSVHTCESDTTGSVPPGDGRVFMYDLMRDSAKPVETLDVCGIHAPVYNLAFNSRVPELFATTDQQSVKVSMPSANQICVYMTELHGMIIRVD